MTTKTLEQMEAEIAALRAELATEKSATKRAPKLTFKVTEKGGVSVYGIQRFPVTLYPNGWARLLEQADELRAFMETNGLDTTGVRQKA